MDTNNFGYGKLILGGTMPILNKLIQKMGRGRDPTVSKIRVMLEILLHQDRAVFGREIADNLPIGLERTSQILKELEKDGCVQIKQVSNRNLYRLTDQGLERLSTKLRDSID